MVKQLAKDVIESIKKITSIEYSERSHQVEVVGKYDGKDVIITLQVRHYIPREVYGEAGETKRIERPRRIKNEKRQWVDVTEKVNKYVLSSAEMKFITDSYVYKHLDQRQIHKLSGIPQPYVYRYIKHMKLKPIYRKTEKNKRNIRFSPSELRSLFKVHETVDIICTDDKSNIAGERYIDTDEIIDDFQKMGILNDVVVESHPYHQEIDFSKPFNIDPHPSRSEWKPRREMYGLKNGENWRNSDTTVNPGPKIQGDGSTATKKKRPKLARREKRRIKNIDKFNQNQPTRYNVDSYKEAGYFDKPNTDK